MDLAKGKNGLHTGLPPGIVAVALSHQRGRWLSAHADGSVRLWNVVTGEQLSHIDLGPTDDSVVCLAFTPSGDGFAAGMYRGVILRFDILD